MFFTKRFNTVFSRLIFSYIILTTSLVLFIGITSHSYYTKKYNDEITKYNNAFLSHIKTSIDSNITKRTVDCALTISIDNFNNADLRYFYTHNPQDNYAKIYSANKYLKSLANTNSEYLKSIHVYYQHGAFMISSSKGLTYQTVADNPSPSLYEVKKKKAKKKSLWTMTDGYSYIHDKEVTQFTYIKYFPYKYLGTTYHGSISIDLQEDALKNIIEDMTKEINSQFYVIDKDGNTLLTVDQSNQSDLLLTNTLLKSITTSEKVSDSFTTQQESLKSVVSYNTLSHTGWKLISVTSMNAFYTQSSRIRQAIVIICLLTITLGIILSALISFRMYSPLKHIMGVIKNKIGYTDDTAVTTTNEYSIINNTLHQFSDKMSDLETALTDSQPIIKHNLIHSLLNHTLTDPKKLEERLQLIHVDFPHPYYRTIILELNALYMDHVAANNGQYIKYLLMTHIESYADTENILLIAELDDNRIAIILNSSLAHNEQYLLNLLEGIYHYAITSFELDTLTIVGSLAHSALDIHRSYKDVLTYSAYQYFIVNKPFVYANDFLGPYENKNVFLRALDQFDKALKNGQLENVTAKLHQMVQDLQAFRYSPKGSQQNLLLILRTLITYIHDMHIPKDKIMTADIYEQFNNIQNITEFTDWVIDMILHTYEYIQVRSTKKSCSVIDTVKDYIMHHTGDDLTLEALGAIVDLSPRYLSKLFKEETGMKFSGYVTDCRLADAAKKLESTDLKVEDICASVGYYSTSHFIRKFKEHFGMTPHKYRTSKQ